MKSDESRNKSRVFAPTQSKPTESLHKHPSALLCPINELCDMSEVITISAPRENTSIKHETYTDTMGDVFTIEKNWLCLVSGERILPNSNNPDQSYISDIFTINLNKIW